MWIGSIVVLCHSWLALRDPIQLRYSTYIWTVSSWRLFSNLLIQFKLVWAEWNAQYTWFLSQTRQKGKECTISSEKSRPCCPNIYTVNSGQFGNTVSLESYTPARRSSTLHQRPEFAMQEFWKSAVFIALYYCILLLYQDYISSTHINLSISTNWFKSR